MLLNLVPSSDTKITTALSDKGRDIGGGKEDQSDRQVLDKGNIEAVLAAELDVGTLEQVKRGAVQPALWRHPISVGKGDEDEGGAFSLLGTAKSRRPSKLWQKEKKKKKAS